MQYNTSKDEEKGEAAAVEVQLHWVQNKTRPAYLASESKKLLELLSIEFPSNNELLVAESKSENFPNICVIFKPYLSQCGFSIWVVHKDNCSIFLEKMKRGAWCSKTQGEMLGYIFPYDRRSVPRVEVTTVNWYVNGHWSFSEMLMEMTPEVFSRVTEKHQHLSIGAPPGSIIDMLITKRKWRSQDSVIIASSFAKN